MLNYPFQVNSTVLPKTKIVKVILKQHFRLRLI